MTPRPAEAGERAAALALACGDRAARAATLLADGSLDPAGLWVVSDGRRVVAAGLGAVLPSGGGVIWPPGGRAELRVAVAAAVRDWLWRSGCRAAQSLVLAEEMPAAVALVTAGFRHVTRMLYLRHFLDIPASFLDRPTCRFEPFDESRFDAYAAVLAATYAGSLDIPEVNGLRSSVESLRGHQSAAGLRHWWLATRGGEPVGLLLANADGDENGWDIAYVGVVPAWRGRGIGAELVTHALLEAKADGREVVSLAVDARNAPARELYRKLGFAEYEAREVLLAVASGPG